MGKRNKVYIVIIVLLLVILWIVGMQINESQSIKSDAFTPPTPTGYIPPTPIISGDYNYDGVLDEQDKILLEH